MNLSDKARAALEEALLNQNSKPLHTLIGLLIRHCGGGSAQDLNNIRSDVYLGLAKLFNKGQTVQEMGRQLYRIVERSCAAYYRRQLNKPATVPLEAVASQAEASLQAEDFGSSSSLSAEQEEMCETVARILSAMSSSGKESDRKRYVAVVAAIAGDDPVEALRREFGPDIAPNNASQVKHRGVEQVKAEYEASKGKKAS